MNATKTSSMKQTLLVLSVTTLLATSLLTSAGCAGYQLGNQSLYTPSVQTIHVPVFQSNSFRPDLGERLTEAVVREIELKTPYKVVPRDRADSVLSGQIVDDSKRVIVKTINSDPRALDFGMRVHVAWTGRHGELIQPGQALVIPDHLLDVGASSTLVPEVGQSVATTQQKAITRLAEQIVSMMENPWP